MDAFKYPNNISAGTSLPNNLPSRPLIFLTKCETTRNGCLRGIFGFLKRKDSWIRRRNQVRSRKESGTNDISFDTCMIFASRQIF